MKEKVNILLVDDREEKLFALETILAAPDYNLVKSLSGKEALRHLLTEDFAVIILDVQMPEMDGFETSELIRKRKKSESTPIIFITAYNKSEIHTLRGYSLGAVDYMFVPIEPEILKSKVKIFVELFRKTEEVKYQKILLEASNEELAKNAKHKDEFLANMSHELRTPLNAILGMSETLLEEVFGSVNEKQKEYLKTIEESGKHLLSLINDILDLSKIEAGKLEVETGIISVKSLCQACVRLIKQTARMKRIKVFTVIDSEMLEIETDERKLKQIIVNLLSNAVKFTPDRGEMGLKVRRDKERQVIDFIVWDRGIGISPEDKGRLFQPFVQLDSSLSRHYSGTGLGLALVRSLTELLGGTVSLESEVGKGSRFTVSILCKKTVEKDFSKKALIIEDCHVFAMLISNFLQIENIKSIIHPLGYSALEKVLEVSPDLIILDIMLPDLSGWDVLEQLKASDVTKDIPVIIISAIDDHSRELSMGVIEYLVKPVSCEQFLKSVKRVFSLKEKGLSPVSMEPEDKKQKLILIAEDNKEDIILYSDYIAAKGYRVITAGTGKEAIKLVKEKLPDLILMDIQMPEMDGIEAMRHIRKMGKNTHIPIIALTSLAMVGDRKRCISAGADDYAAKPVHLKRLMEMIEKCLSL